VCGLRTAKRCWDERHGLTTRLEWTEQEGQMRYSQNYKSCSSCLFQDLKVTGFAAFLCFIIGVICTDPFAYYAILTVTV
jgi:hypothetical protein